LPLNPVSRKKEEKVSFYVGWAKAGAQDLAEGLWQKAALALELALEMEGQTVLGFDEILARGGRIIDLLPMNRVVINLGRKMGLRPHLRFKVISKETREERGKLIPLEIQEEIAVAEVVHLKEAAVSLQKGDLLVPDSQPQAEWPLYSFQENLREALKTAEQFSLLIARLDDYKDRITLWGEEGFPGIRIEIRETMEKKIPAGGLVGPYGQDGFILFLPGMDRQEGVVWAKTMVEEIFRTLNGSVSFALADYPLTDFHKLETFDNLLKAMDHLGFLGPKSVVAFDAVSLNISGDKFYNAGEQSEALREYEKALALDPKNINVLNSLGVCFANLGQYERAIQTFREVLSLSPQDFMAAFNLGFGLEGRGDYRGALDTWEALAQREGSFDLAYHLGRLYREQGDLDKAAHWFKKAEEAPERKGVIYRALGEVQEARGLWKEAMNFFKKALKANPQDAGSLSRLGALYLERESSLNVALSLCQQATRIDPKKGLYWFNLGRAYLKNTSYQEAVAAFQKALNLGENSKEVFRSLGHALKNLGKEEEALEMFKEILKRDPEDEEARRFLIRPHFS
jgi:tetratricopeptide (TPR) repeat protein